LAIGRALVFALSRIVERQAYPVGELPWIVASVVGLLSMMTLIACRVSGCGLDVDPVAAFAIQMAGSPTPMKDALGRNTAVTHGKAEELPMPLNRLRPR